VERGLHVRPASGGALLAVKVVLARGRGEDWAEETQGDERELAVLPIGKKGGQGRGFHRRSRFAGVEEEGGGAVVVYGA